MPRAPNLKIGEWSRGSAWVLGDTPGIQDWESAGEQLRAKIEKRFQIICTADGNHVDSTKLRRIEGVPGIYEAKFQEPLKRVWCFRAAGAWFVTHITDKPGENRVLAEAKKCAAWRDEYLAELKAEAEKRKAAERNRDAETAAKPKRRSTQRP